MDIQVLVFPQRNDVLVTARFPDIADGTGIMAELYSKPDRMTPDDDPGVLVYSAALEPDPDNPGQTMAVFTVPEADTQVPRSDWWHVDAVDVNDKRRTAAYGPLWVEAV
jgi:hypothetical protein